MLPFMHSQSSLWKISYAFNVISVMFSTRNETLKIYYKFKRPKMYLYPIPLGRNRNMRPVVSLV